MSSIPVPPQFQTVQSLGEPLSVYKGGGLMRWGSVLFCILGACLVPLVFYYALTYQETYPNVAAQNVPVLLIVGLLLALGLLLWAWRILARWTETAVVYAEGLAHYNGQRILVYEWNQIAAITAQVIQYRYYGIIKAGTSHKYTLTHLNGKQLKLDDHFHHVAELFDRIRERTFRPILTRCCQAYDMGDTVQFGAFAISQAQGVLKGKKSYPWSEIGDVSVIQGTVTIKPKRGGLFSGMSAPVAKVLNLDVFLAMVQELAGLPQSGS